MGAPVLGLAALLTASISALGRAFCLPPYWPAEYILRCHPTGFASALPGAFFESVITAIILALYSLPAAVLILLGVMGLRRSVRGAALQGLAAAAGGGAWIWIVRALEPSPLDFLVGWYATGAGALVAGIIMWRAARSDRFSSSPPVEDAIARGTPSSTA